MIKFVMFCLVLIASPALATTRYVSTTGSGSTCSDGDPCSLATGLAATTAGDTIYLQGGTYTGNLSTTLLNPIPSGISSSQPTIMAGKPGDTAILAPSTGPSGNVIMIGAARSNVTFRNLTLDGTNLGSSSERGGFRTTTTASVTGLIFEQNTVRNVYGSLITIGDATNGAIVRQNSLHDSTTSMNSTSGNCVYNRGPNMIFEYNECYNTKKYGLTLRGPGTIARYNVVRNVNLCAVASGETCIELDPGLRAIAIAEGSDAGPNHNIRVHNNIVHHAHKGIQVNGSGTGIKIENNVVYAMTSLGITVSSGVAPVTITNNISVGNGTAISDFSGQAVLTTNLTTGSATDIYVDPANNDFSLKPGSAALDSGTTISGFSPCVSTCDRGVYEVPKINSCSATSNTLSLVFDNPRYPPMSNLAVTGITATIDGTSRSLSAPTIVGSNQVDITFSGAVVSATAAVVGSTSVTITDTANIGNVATNVQKVLNWASTNCNVTGGGGASIAQTHFRGADLPGLDGSQIWLKAEDTNFTVQQGGCARIRLKVACTGGDCLPFAPVVRAQKDAGSYTAIPNEFSTDNIKYYGTSDTSADIPAHLASICTERLTNDQASNVCASFLRADVSVPNIDLTENSEAELEAAICIDRDETVGTTYQLRVYKGDGNALDSYAQTPTITVKSPGMYQTGQLGPWDLEIRLGSELKMGGIRRRVTDRSRFVYPDIPKSAVVYQVQ